MLEKGVYMKIIKKYLEEFVFAGLVASTCVILAVLFALTPSTITILIYKLCMVFMAGVAGFWLDRVIFPYAQPRDYLVMYDKGDPEFVPSYYKKNFLWLPVLGVLL